jgi:hypothetical protein
VEIAELTEGGWAVRDSKNPTGPALIVTSSEWTAFTADVRDGKLA